MEREAVLVGIDVGTTKVTALIGEVGRDGGLTIIGKGTMSTTGLKKGVVVNIEQTVHSITGAVEQAERLSGWKIDRAFVGVGGQHVESQNSRGAVAVSGHDREVTREDINRATEVARAVSIPSNREVLHVLPRQFIVDGQEGVKDPLGMSAIRLEVETHIVTGSATAVQNLTKCVVAAGVKIDELVADSLASAEAVLTETEKELGVAVADIGAGTIDLALFEDGSPFHTSVLPVGGNNVTMDIAAVLKTSLQVAEELKIRHGTCDLRAVDPDEQINVETPRRGGRPDGQPARALPDHRGPDARDLRAASPTRCAPRGTACCRPGSSSPVAPPSSPAPPSSAARSSGCRSGSSGPSGRRRPRRQPPDPGQQHGDRAAPLGRGDPRPGRAQPLRVGPGDGRARPDPGRAAQHLPLTLGSQDGRQTRPPPGRPAGRRPALPRPVDAPGPDHRCRLTRRYTRPTPESAHP